MKKPWRYIGIGAILLLGLAGYATYWKYAAGFLEKQWNVLRTNIYEAPEVARLPEGTPVSGFPIRFQKDFTDFEMTTATGDGIWQWQGEHATLFLRPWNWQTLYVELRGNHHILGPAGALGLKTGFSVAALTFNRMGKVEAVHTEFQAASLERVNEPLSGGPYSALPSVISIAEGELAGSDLLASERKFAITLSGLHLPARWPLLLGPEIRTLELQGEMEGVLSIPASPRAWAEAFYASGGVVHFRHVRLDWGPVQAEGEASLSLDQDLQPLLTATLRIRGHAHLIDLLVADGQMAAGEAMLAKLGLAAMETIAEDGSREVTAPVTVQDGVVSLGPISVLRLPRAEWPDS